MERKSLTKENYWDAVSEEYPLSMEVFGAWIDGYKKENNWDVLFNARQSQFEALETKSPKYHELPCAIQQGIWIEFCMEVLRDYFGFSEYRPSDDFEADVVSDLSKLEKLIIESHGK